MTPRCGASSASQPAPVSTSAKGVSPNHEDEAVEKRLNVLFGQPDRSFYANEMIALAASGSGAVQRELARLEASALVTAKRVGNQKHYQANQEAPIYAELRGIILKTFGVSDVLRAALQPVWPMVELAFVYGSLATAPLPIIVELLTSILTRAWSALQAQKYPY